MIPWRLTFSGVRDYTPTLVDLSGIDQHVLITGPNGAGKSTITFCMGAVLYSSKVDIEGLKSRNLSTEQTWRARISFLFKNDGWMKIDAPAFIEFTLFISQDPGQPLKRSSPSPRGIKSISGMRRSRTHLAIAISIFLHTRKTCNINTRSTRTCFI